MRQSALDQIERKAAENRVDYTPVFGELGMKSEDKERLLVRLQELHRKAIAAERPMQELAKARLKYDQDIRSVLGETNYAKFVAFERSKPARREYVWLSTFALHSNNLAMDPVYSQRIVQLLKDAKATTTESWEGPYDPMPHPEAKDNQGAFSDSIHLLGDPRQKATNVTELLRKRDFPYAYRRAIEDYYAWKIKEMEERIAWFSLPADEQVRRMIQDRNPSPPVRPGELH